MIKDIKQLKDCPDCASHNIIHSTTRDQLICRECGLIYEPLTPAEEAIYEKTHETMKKFLTPKEIKQIKPLEIKGPAKVTINRGENKKVNNKKSAVSSKKKTSKNKVPKTKKKTAKKTISKARKTAKKKTVNRKAAKRTAKKPARKKASKKKRR
ncbi:hypothetical protein COV18_06440 [Candidatus Woesearchaeota archaeon CG10_big_fil_rev_8_21_14_0_10_37_12]|nr:MAG: hypothetical protein COV18_06440 [Candidatus Woesearchaeota archaeon CG10_big_fil_rev_8_21_14_0_10_37_12]